jgi:hypothetical protein
MNFWTLLTIPENLRLFPSKNEANKSKEGPRMPTILKVEDLHEAYHAASKEDAIAMANLGAICYQSVREGLFAQWSTAEDVAKADTWREEGRQSMFETLKSKLAAAEGMSVRLLAAETALEEAHAAMETRISGRVSETLDSFRKDYELVKMKEIAAMQQRIAAAEAREEMIEMVKKSNTAMEEKIAMLEAQVAEQLAANTKSSHAIGKAGEAAVLELLQGVVSESFAYVVVKDMTTVGHAADFHVSLIGPNGRRIKILVDSKKYKRAVNSDEIDKLHTDVDSDEEATSGIMVSLNSGICGTKQFTIGRTPKQKPILYISFQDMSPEMQREVICWAFRTLITVVGEGNRDGQQAMIDKIEELLSGVNGSIKSMDGVIRMQMKVLESMREARTELMKSVTEYRGEVEHVEMEEGCEGIVKATGARCGKKVVEEGRCGNHRIKK